jgi:hypothetical protein
MTRPESVDAGREDLRQVLCANDDTRRVGRGSPRTHLVTRRGASFAYRRTSRIDRLKIDDGFMHRVATPVTRAQGGREDG